MADFFIDRMAQKVIAQWITKWDSKPEATAELRASWKAMTRLMFWNYTATDVYTWVEEALKEASDEQYLEHKIHLQSQQEVNKELNKKPINIVRGEKSKIINAKLKITEVAKAYGIIVKHKKSVCPFHNDKDPSLSFNDEKNVYNCFGCNSKGDIVNFIQKMEELKVGKERGS